MVLYDFTRFPFKSQTKNLDFVEALFKILEHWLQGCLDEKLKHQSEVRMYKLNYVIVCILFRINYIVRVTTR